jgi:hypothetical protein
MTHSLSLRLGDANDLTWAQHIVVKYHYLHRRVDPRARPMVYVLRLADDDMHRPLGLVMLGIPHATRCGGCGAILACRHSGRWLTCAAFGLTQACLAWLGIRFCPHPL